MNVSPWRSRSTRAFRNSSADSRRRWRSASSAAAAPAAAARRSRSSSPANSLALILEPAVRLVERGGQRVERRGDAVLVGREQRLLAHERDLLAQPFELGVDQLAAALRIGVRGAARADHLELLLEAALQLVVGVAALQPRRSSRALLLVEVALLALRRRDHLQDRGARGEQLQVQPGHLAHVADLRLGARRCATADRTISLAWRSIVVLLVARARRRASRSALRSASPSPAAPGSPRRRWRESADCARAPTGTGLRARRRSARSPD